MALQFTVIVKIITQMLIFSGWLDLLELVAAALAANGVPHALARGRGGMAAALARFKDHPGEEAEAEGVEGVGGVEGVEGPAGTGAEETEGEGDGGRGAGVDVKGEAKEEKKAAVGGSATGGADAGASTVRRCAEGGGIGCKRGNRWDL